MHEIFDKKYKCFYQKFQVNNIYFEILSKKFHEFLLENLKFMAKMHTYSNCWYKLNVFLMENLKFLAFLKKKNPIKTHENY